MIRSVFLGLALVIAASSAGADAVTTLCKLKVSNDQAWVPTQVVIRRDKGSDAVLVNDPIILHFIKKPVVGRVMSEDRKRVTYAWELRQIRNTRGQTTPTFRYRATVEKATGDVLIRAFPFGYDNIFTAKGQCRSK